MRQEPVLVTGATGYVGRRLVRLLLNSGYRVRAAVRSLEKFNARQPDHPNLEVARADLLNPKEIARAARGCFATYYLVHSLSDDSGDYPETERKTAENMVRAAAGAGLERIIYLGGLGERKEKLSRHLTSRDEVAGILRTGPVPVTVLRAGMIIGSGSASFEILRYVVDRLPVIVVPKSLHTRCQPICIRNVLGYLKGCLELDETTGETYDICGPDIITYTDLLKLYAEAAGLKNRKIITNPYISLGMTAYLIGLISPVPAPIVRELVYGLKNEVVCADNRIGQIIPQDLMTCRQSIERALEKIDQQIVDTFYFDAGITTPPEWAFPGDEPYSGGPVMECAYKVRMAAGPMRVWEPIKQIGGINGWYFGGSLWWLRGFMDKLVGGVGIQRGRRHPVDIAVGDVIDFWRVLDVKPGKRLLLLAEMKLPGEAILEFRLSPADGDETELVMNARFLALGLAGLAYWHSISPLHDYVFKGMLKNIAKACGADVVLPPHRIDLP